MKTKNKIKKYLHVLEFLTSIIIDVMNEMNEWILKNVYYVFFSFLEKISYKKNEIIYFRQLDFAYNDQK